MAFLCDLFCKLLGMFVACACACADAGVGVGGLVCTHDVLAARVQPFSIKFCGLNCGFGVTFAFAG